MTNLPIKQNLKKMYSNSLNSESNNEMLDLK